MCAQYVDAPPVSGSSSAAPATNGPYVQRSILPDQVMGGSRKTGSPPEVPYREAHAVPADFYHHRSARTVCWIWSGSWS